MDKDLLEFHQYIRKFKKVVIWGLRRQYHTHRYIHQGFYQNLKKLGVPAVWADYHAKPSLIEKGDLVISSAVQGRGVGKIELPLADGVYYCLHNFAEDVVAKIPAPYRVSLQVYTSKADAADQKWGEVTYFDTKTQTLFQPWGTNLLPEEFKTPTFNNHKRVVWVGSVWNNPLGQGNVNEMGELKRALANNAIKFSAVRFVPDWLSIALIRYSRLAPAIAGRWQAENNYLPCRMFKNISYGQLGFSNVEKFNDVYKGAIITGSTITELADRALSLPKGSYLETIRRQQEITKQHTYMHKLIHICKAFETVNH
jgi:hypothetical protein